MTGQLGCSVRFAQLSFSLPQKLLSIIQLQALHEEATAAMRAYTKTLHYKFPFTIGVHQGCVLAPTLFNLYFIASFHRALDDYQMNGRGASSISP